MRWLHKIRGGLVTVALVLHVVAWLLVVVMVGALAYLMAKDLGIDIKKAWRDGEQRARDLERLNRMWGE